MYQLWDIFGILLELLSCGIPIFGNLFFLILLNDCSKNTNNIPSLQPGTLFVCQNKKTQSLSFTEDHDGRTTYN